MNAIWTDIQVRQEQLDALRRQAESERLISAGLTVRPRVPTSRTLNQARAVLQR